MRLGVKTALMLAAGFAALGCFGWRLAVVW